MRGEARLSQDCRKGPVAFPANCEHRQVGKLDQYDYYYRVKAESPRFDGQGSWSTFEKKFRAMLRANNIDEESKELLYLSSALQGSVSDWFEKKIKHMGSTYALGGREVALRDALHLLKNRYAKDENLKTTQVEQGRMTPLPQSKNIKGGECVVRPNAYECKVKGDQQGRSNKSKTLLTKTLLLSTLPIS